MPHSASQIFLRELDQKAERRYSCNQPIGHAPGRPPLRNLAGPFELFATIPLQHAELHAKDILSHGYEYFLGQFAMAEGKKGGQYFTPKSIVSLIVEMIELYQGRVCDPAMGSGGFFAGITGPSGGGAGALGGEEAKILSADQSKCKYLGGRARNPWRN